MNNISPDIQTLVTLLIRSVLAHFVADFVLQSKKIASHKKWNNRFMLYHISTIILTNLLFTGAIVLSAYIALSHYLIDSIKTQPRVEKRLNDLASFLIDQALHLFAILIICIFSVIPLSIILPLTTSYLPNNHLLVILIAYIFILHPASLIIGHLTKKIQPPEIEENNNSITGIERGGKIIGHFERVIILTFVLLNQFEAIGFLITGKSIIRFADRNSNLKSEYVLVGTMASYALAIITGVFVNLING